uniref:Signal recognition particle 19 kDa protein n=1 Tax=Capra hircus TaxID=9925 RepID=A0A8C2NX31_CAPHI
RRRKCSKGWFPQALRKEGISHVRVPSRERKGFQRHVRNQRAETSTLSDGRDFRRKRGGLGPLRGLRPAFLPVGPDRVLSGRGRCLDPGEDGLRRGAVPGRPGQAVENPTATEIQDVCAAVGLNVFLEKNKMYSREWNRDLQYRGRVRVQLKQEDGSLCLVQFPSRKSVMLYAAEMIPKLKTRTQKTGGGDQSLQQGEGSKKGKGKKKK